MFFLYTVEPVLESHHGALKQTDAAFTKKKKGGEQFEISSFLGTYFLSNTEYQFWIIKIKSKLKKNSEKRKGGEEGGVVFFLLVIINKLLCYNN